jgi:hypothetical protein
MYTYICIHIHVFIDMRINKYSHIYISIHITFLYILKGGGDESKERGKGATKMEKE